MPTLYVENVPRDLYDALRKRAKSQRRSIAAEVLSLLEDSIPTAKVLRARRKLFKKTGSAEGDAFPRCGPISFHRRDVA